MFWNRTFNIPQQKDNHASSNPNLFFLTISSISVLAPFSRVRALMTTRDMYTISLTQNSCSPSLDTTSDYFSVPSISIVCFPQVLLDSISSALLYLLLSKTFQIHCCCCFIKYHSVSEKRSSSYHIPYNYLRLILSSDYDRLLFNLKNIKSHRYTRGC